MPSLGRLVSQSRRGQPASDRPGSRVINSAAHQADGPQALSEKEPRLRRVSRKRNELVHAIGNAAFCGRGCVRKLFSARFIHRDAPRRLMSRMYRRDSPDVPVRHRMAAIVANRRSSRQHLVHPRIRASPRRNLSPTLALSADIIMIQSTPIAHAAHATEEPSLCSSSKARSLEQVAQHVEQAAAMSRLCLVSGSRPRPRQLVWQSADIWSEPWFLASCSSGWCQHCHNCRLKAATNLSATPIVNGTISLKILDGAQSAPGG